jgi:hypothetical protein
LWANDFLTFESLCETRSKPSLGGAMSIAAIMPAIARAFPLMLAKALSIAPVAREEVRLLLIEPTGTPNTGDVNTAAPRKTA